MRRSSDNTTQDIGFNASGDLDTAALLVFVGSGDGYITIWYDQSVNGANGVQTTSSAQPMIVSAGNIITAMNSTPSIKFYNGAISVLNVTLNAFSSGYAVNAVAVNTGTQTYATIVNKTASNQADPWDFYGSSGNWLRWYSGNGSSSYSYNLSGAYDVPTCITCQVSSSTKAGSFYYNGTSIASGTFSAYQDGTVPITIGTRGDSLTWLDGNLSELVLFASPLSDTDRHLLERNQGTRFGITVA